MARVITFDNKRWRSKLKLTPPAKLERQIFESIIQQANESIIITSADLAPPGPTILFVNSAFTQLTGYTVEEAIGRSLQLLQGSRTDQKALERLWQRLKQGEACSIETVNYTKNGTELYVEWEVTPVRTEAQQITHFSAIIRNITKRKQAEKVLQQALDKLEELSRLKDDFLSTVSHELRTPIANMKMAIRMLRLATNWEARGKVHLPCVSVENKVNHYLQILEDECQRESNLIDDLLDLQKLEAESWSSNLEAIELQTWLPELIKPFKQQLYERQQTLDIDIPAQLPALISDRTSLERILSELMDNACKYTPSGEEITVKVKTKAGIKSLHLQVINSGVEISPIELNKIFDKFYRIPRGDCWKEGGTGLGLALVKKLTESLSGTIQVESAANQTSFTITLPFAPLCPINGNKLGQVVAE